MLTGGREGWKAVTHFNHMNTNKERTYTSIPLTKHCRPTHAGYDTNVTAHTLHTVTKHELMLH